MTKINFVRIGRFVRPHGLKGELLTHSFTQDPLDIGSYAPLYALPPETSLRFSEKDLPSPLALNHIRHGSHSGFVVVSIEGLTTRSHAENFIRKPLDLFISRAQLKDDQLEEEEFFHADLIGLQVYNEHGLHVGRVVALHNFGAGDLLEIECAADTKPHAGLNSSTKGKKETVSTLMIPFRHAFVTDIDLQNQRLTIRPDDKDDLSVPGKEP